MSWFLILALCKTLSGEGSGQGRHMVTAPPRLLKGPPPPTGPRVKGNSLKLSTTTSITTSSASLQDPYKPRKEWQCHMNTKQAKVGHPTAPEEG